MLVLTIVLVPSLIAQPDKNKEIATQMINAINDRDYDLLDEIMAPDLVRHCQSTPNLNIRSLNEFKEFLKEDLKTFPDSHITTEMLIAEDRSGCRLSYIFRHSERSNESFPSDK